MCDQGYAMEWYGDGTPPQEYEFIPEHSPPTTDQGILSTENDQNDMSEMCGLAEAEGDGSEAQQNIEHLHDDESASQDQRVVMQTEERPVTPWNTPTPVYRPNTTAVTPPLRDPVGAPKMPPDCPAYPVGTMPMNITGGVLPGYGSRGPIAGNNPRMQQPNQYAAMPVMPLPGRVASVGPMPMPMHNYGQMPFHPTQAVMPTGYNNGQYFGQSYGPMPTAYGYVPTMQPYGPPLHQNSVPVPYGLDGYRQPGHGYYQAPPNFGYGLQRPSYVPYPPTGALLRGPRHFGPLHCVDIPTELTQAKTINTVDSDTCVACGHSQSANAMAQAIHTVVHKKYRKSVFPEYVHAPPKAGNKPFGTLMIRLDPTPAMNPKVDWEELEGGQPAKSSPVEYSE